MKTLENYFAEYVNGKSAREIADEMNISESYFRSLLSLNDVTKYKSRLLRKSWSKSELEYLKENYNKIHINNLCKILNRPEISIRIKANKLNIYKTKRIFNKRSEYMKGVLQNKYLLKHSEKIDKYLEIYKNHKNYITLSEELNVTQESLRSLRKKANLPNILPVIDINEYFKCVNKYKNIKDIASHFDISVIQMNKFIHDNNLQPPTIIKKYGLKWTTTQINKLKTLYTDHTAKECAVMLGRSFESIKSKLKELKIKK